MYLLVMIALAIAFPRFASAVTPTADEMTAAGRWATAKFGDAGGPKSTAVPFSFTYGGRSSRELLKTWKCQKSIRRLDAARREHTLVYTDPKTGLEVRCVAIAYTDYPAVEWVVYFENKGEKDTPIIANVQALDTMLTVEQQPKEVVVRHARGTKAAIDDFGPIDDALAPGGRLRIGSGGKCMSTVEALPYFNIDLSSEGMIAAVGWSGMWSAKFVRNSPQSVSVRAGMETTHLLLHPGERIRTPRMLVLLWQNDRLRGHNLWRRLIVAHYSPRPGGKPLVGPLCDSSWGAVKAEDQIAKINWWGDNNMPLDVFWIDAGWSGKTGEHAFDAAANRVPNPELYPNGMKEVSDAARKRGLKFLLWTWPHRALPGVEVGAEHPQWIIKGDSLDHGDPVVNKWMIEKYSRSVDEHGLDIFRQDGHVVISDDSGPNRQGVNQIRYFEGFYAFWDALLKRHPHLLIDNCSGGARKLDIEAASRSIALWRSDYLNKNNNNFDPICVQGMTYGLSFYVPYSGGCAIRTDRYSVRSGYGPAMCLMWHAFPPGSWDIIKKIDDKDFNFRQARKLLNDYLSIRECFYGDFYPLTPYSVAPDCWMAWQFDLPEKGRGMVQAFRRQKTNDETRKTFRLMGLDPEARYETIDLDVGTPKTATGRQLMEEGLAIEIKDKPGAAVITIRSTNY